MVKEKYTPTSAARFKFSKDRWSQERRAFLTGYKAELEQALPGVTIAFGLYGSLTKGKPLANRRWLGLRKGNLQVTDVDLSIFYDDDEFRNVLLMNGQEFVESRRDLISGVYTAAEMEGDTDEARERRHWYVDTLALRLRYRMNPNDDMKMRIEAHINPIRTGVVPGSLFADMQKLMADGVPPDAEKTEIPGAFEARRKLARAFHLDFGGGLRRYRIDFLEQLARLPKEEGERAWQYVCALVKNWERLGDIPESIEGQYPDTLDEALRYYRVPQAKPAAA